MIPIRSGPPKQAKLTMTNTDKNTLTFAHLTDAHLPLHGAFRARELAGKRAFSALNWKRKRHRAHLRRVVDAPNGSCTGEDFADGAVAAIEDKTIYACRMQFCQCLVEFYEG